MRLFQAFFFVFFEISMFSKRLFQTEFIILRFFDSVSKVFGNYRGFYSNLNVFSTNSPVLRLF